MKNRFVINDTPFQTKKSLLERLRAILYDLPPGNDLTAEQTAFVTDLVEQCHPEAENKLGVGVKRMWRNVTDHGSVSFFLERLDGTTTDFSFMKCLNPPTPYQIFAKAARTAISQDIFTFRDKAFAAGPLQCPYTGQSLAPHNCHIDHEPPKTFASLLELFLSEESIDWATIRIRPGKDNSVVKEFEDAGFAAKWRQWHLKNARLRVLSRFGNLSHSVRENRQ